jgi:hypothetical protein
MSRARSRESVVILPLRSRSQTAFCGTLGIVYSKPIGNASSKP